MTLPTAPGLAEESRILITGGAGFIGSHLAEALLNDGHHVTALDDLSTGRFENIAHLADHPRFRYAIDSITNEVVVDRLTSECSVVFHLAAAVGVRLIVDHPVNTIERNVFCTEAVLKAALRYRSKVVIASTSEVYGKSDNVPFREDGDIVLGPSSRSRWSYAASKLVGEFLALAYHRENDLPIMIVRLFNTVGPRQSERYGMVIPRFVQQALAGEPLTVYGDGRQSRCFLHVADAVEGLIGLAGCPAAVGQIYNVGSTEEVTILDLAEKVLELVDTQTPALGGRPTQGSSANPHLGRTESGSAISWPKENRRIVFVPYEQAYAAGFEDMRRRAPDISKIFQRTGWAPKRSLDQVLRDVVASCDASAARTR